MRRWLIVRPG